MKAGDTFWLEGNIHLWMIISDPVIDPDQVLIVSFTSWMPLKDGSCVIGEGEHPFVKHATCIAYDHAQVISLAKLVELRDARKLRPYEPLSQDLLRQVRKGAQITKRMANEYRALLKSQKLI